MINTSLTSAVLLNARSVKNKLPELHQLIYTHPFNFVFITETWLNNEVTDAMLDPDHKFVIYRRDRPNRPGGGTMAMISTSIKSHKYDLDRDEQNILDSCGCEVLCIDVLIQPFKYRLIIVYRPPSSCFISKPDLLTKTVLLKELITKLTHPTSTPIIMGDFNLPKINWLTLEMPTDGVHDVLYDCLTELGYFQFVNDVTRLSITGNLHTLDLILSTDDMSINVDNISAPLGNVRPFYY